MQQAIAYLDNAPAGFFTADADGTIDYLNATLAQWLGLDLAEIAGAPLKLAEIMSQDGAALVARAGRGAAQGATAPLRHRPRQGRRHDPSGAHPASPCPAIGGNGGLAHALVLNRAPGEAEEAGAAELRFARLFNSAPIAIATVDREGAISATNAAFVRLFGRALDGAPAGKVSLGEPRRATRAGKALRKALDAAIAGQGLIEPIDVAFAGDKERSGRFYLSPIEQAEGESEAAIVYAIDTTEQRALEMQIAQSQKMQAVGQLAGGIAHDFNNMLTAIIGFSDFLLMNHRPTDPAFQDIMNIKQNANRAAGLVRQLLAFSRQQTLRPQVLAARRRAVRPLDPARPAARREHRAQARSGRRPVAGQGRPAPVRAGDHQPRGQRARRHARRRQARHPHRQCHRAELARARPEHRCSPATMC